MTRNEIIEHFYNSKDVADAISKMRPIELQDDLRQEIFLVLCEMSDERIQEMWHEGWKRKDCGEKLKHYIVRMMLNMMMSNRSSFFVKFRKSFIEWSAEHDIAFHPVEDDMAIVRVEETNKELHWYEREVLKLYSENGCNVMQLARDTKIPYRSLFKTISKLKKEMQVKIRQHGDD